MICIWIVEKDEDRDGKNRRRVSDAEGGKQQTVKIHKTVTGVKLQARIKYCQNNIKIKANSVNRPTPKRPCPAVLASDQQAGTPERTVQKNALAKGSITSGIGDL